MALTPMMGQYLQMKEQYKDCILFFRLGDFYEMFFQDAELASRELEITLTGRDCGLEARAPMCGIPYHAADGYIAKLIAKGYKVAICEQVEDPTLAKGIVKRDVIRVITPGTVTDGSMLDERKNNYLMCVFKAGHGYGIAVVDLSTGDFTTTSINWGNIDGKLLDETAKYAPSEMVVNGEFFRHGELMEKLRKRFGIYISSLEDECFEELSAEGKVMNQFSDVNFSSYDGALSIRASGALLHYLQRTQKVNLLHIRKLHQYKQEEFMILDAATRRNLELTESMREKSRKGTLLWVVDRTITSMGGRLLRKWIERPLISLPDILERLDSVQELKERYMVRMEGRELLRQVYDMERLMGKVSLGNLNGRDLVALKKSIGQIPFIKELLQDCSAAMNRRLLADMDDLKDVHDLLESAILEEPPISIKEGGIIKTGFHDEVDRLRNASREGKSWIAAMESTQREKTGIKNLKIGYSKVFGYFLEVTPSYYSMVPAEYIRKQTLTNCERFITEELKELEETVLGAQDKLMELEYKIFNEIRQQVTLRMDRISNAAKCLAALDVLCALSEVADRENYCRPQMTAVGEIIIKDGRHPVVEKMLDRNTFVPNDTCLDLEEHRLDIITGPNMAGKSTYMRQVALIVLMAQMGSFVPASEARIGIADRIFTRVGASDDLAAGQSTFMVEMSEVANILTNATGRSLLILDEIGRGTSTFDGLSIAWSVIEFISEKERLGARTLFATHYHELTELEGKITGIMNYCIAVEEKGEDIIFLRKIIRGGADDSYGIQVARLAGVPAPVIERAREILRALEDADISKKEMKGRKGKRPMEGQFDLFTLSGATMVDKAAGELLSEIRGIDVTTLTPLDALNVLYRLSQQAKGLKQL